jgi:DNA-binding response OmpR family regulator
MLVMNTVLLIDSDVGFVFWLGQGLGHAGYKVIPAESVSRAKALLDEVKMIVDLLVVNTALPHAAGLVESLRRLNPSVKVVALIDNQPALDQIPDADVHCRRPTLTDESTRQDLMAQIEKVLPPFTIH